ncbi:MAG: DNA topoisomerase IV subunit B [Muribaculaceae bacterium]|jgi:topoisomerase-4 subunit B|nr:DNA topoisomerase IV subunit B [Muribaculaceae bacterium]ROT19782.1 type IIA DNA topoisomerase subunit B [Muribaculaceae bacterium Isolate-113 (HZI)]ROT20172.1 type IIA DNA topoisomerase subunit B [Muribaculaceae bacterium Isolate-114 (HZI)]
MNNDIFEIEEREETAPSTAASSNAGTYDDNAIQTLKWNEHIRRRPGMYIGKLGDGTHSDDGIYVLIKEVVDNSIDEFNMGAGKRIDITLTEEGEVTVRDYGRGIPLGKVKEVASDINTGGKFDDKNFKKSVGLNGVGLKAVNALSTYCHVASVRDGKKVEVEFERGDLIRQSEPIPTDEPNGTLVRFTPDPTLFQNYRFNQEFVETMVNNYTYLNAGLQLFYNGRKYYSRHGLLDLLRENMTNDPLYPIIHLSGEDIEVVLTHTDQYGEEYYSFVNGQHTTQGGTHLTAFREHVTRTIKEFSGKGYEFSDIRNGLVAAVSVRIQEPVFESQTKTKLGSKEVAPGSSLTVNKFIGDFIKKELDDYLHRNPDIAEIMLRKIASSEKERKAMAGVAKLAREKAKKVSLHNRKLRDCRVHYNDPLKAKAKEDRREDSAIFITEGDSASGTITKVRNAETQAVFSLRGKPLNSYGMTQEVVYKNDEFNLLQAALNIEEGIEGLRYNKVIIATDADVDGMHIRLLIITFFLMFFPDLVKKGHVYILQTPLFRVRDKNAVRRTKKKNRKKEETEGEKDTFYCYTDEEREAAIARFGNNAEITRFKGLGEINDAEFAEFIGPDMRLDRVKLKREDAVEKLLEFYMGKNTMERQNFIIDNLVIEDDSEI